jgi:ankyrin repeat protein
MALRLSKSEIQELVAAFADMLNYVSEDPSDPIDPLTYISPDNDNCLHIAAQRGNLRAVELLVKAGLDVNAPGDMGYTALHYATDPKVVAFLLSHGASRDIPSEFGTVPKG